MSQFLSRIAAPLISQQTIQTPQDDSPPPLTRSEMEGLFARELGS